MNVIAGFHRAADRRLDCFADWLAAGDGARLRSAARMFRIAFYVALMIDLATAVARTDQRQSVDGASLSVAPFIESFIATVDIRLYLALFALGAFLLAVSKRAARRGGDARGAQNPVPNKEGAR